MISPAIQYAICSVQRLRMLVLMALLVPLVACNSSNSSSDLEISNPAVEGPIEGNPTLLGTTSFELASVGYEQSEFFFSGEAKSYKHSGDISSDGKWQIEDDSSAAYKSRLLVYRPSNPADFNGTVIIEWLNVSGGPDTAAEWMASHTELTRSGFAWVGISAQYAGIEGGGVNFSGLELHLKAFNAERYGSLSHPGDKFAFDIFSQAAKAITSPGSINPLEGLEVEHVLAVGVSQSADFMVTYLNTFAKQVELFDGYLVHSRFRGTVGLQPEEFSGSEGVDFTARNSARIRDDLDKPVMVLQTENDILEFGGYYERQADTDTFRWWEIAGTAHADIYIAQNGRADTGTNPDIAAVEETPFPLYGCSIPVNSGPQHFVAKAAIAALNNWVSDGTAPPYADRLVLNDDATAYKTDSLGNALGGIRTPYVDVPVARLSGSGQTGSILCLLFGTTEIFDTGTLMSLYPDHATFTSMTDTAVDNAVQAGFLLPVDGELIKAWAESSDYGIY